MSHEYIVVREDYLRMIVENANTLSPEVVNMFKEMISLEYGGLIKNFMFCVFREHLNNNACNVIAHNDISYGLQIDFDNVFVVDDKLFGLIMHSPAFTGVTIDGGNSSQLQQLVNVTETVMELVGALVTYITNTISSCVRSNIHYEVELSCVDLDVYNTDIALLFKH